jgi:hypothetical protein
MRAANVAPDGWHNKATIISVLVPLAEAADYKRHMNVYLELVLTRNAKLFEYTALWIKSSVLTENIRRKLLTLR